jgi:hypothetical protein
MAATDVDRRREILHQDKLAATHVPPVGLQQKRPGIPGYFAHSAIVE